MHISIVLNKEKYARSYKFITSIVVQVHVACLNYNIQNLWMYLHLGRKFFNSYIVITWLIFVEWGV